ncbi:carboxypeptidase regulatory-like domain-containing protein [Solicola sp. PLA-1-18]|uniref:carboxypeptidase regulatory-like domain-containing protein n=1 Tax=Solicola sp. PLA-1-18 TaxID=3380532 RepID=UPI003B7E2E33
MSRSLHRSLAGVAVVAAAGAVVTGLLVAPAMAAGDTLAGTVRDAAGKPVVGATVRILDTSCSSVIDELTTDSDGEWGVFLDLGSYKLETRHPSMAPELYRDAVSCSASTTVTPGPTDFDTVIGAGTTVSGTLRSTSGAALPAGRYTVRATTDRTQPYASVSTTSSSYSMPLMAAGGYRLTVLNASGASIGSTDVTVGSAAVNADIRTSATDPTPTPSPTPSPSPSPTTPAPTTPAPTTPAPTTPAPTTPAPTTPAPTTPAPTTPAPTTPAPTTPAPAPTAPAPTTPAPTTPAPTTPAPTTPAPTTPAPTTPAPTTPAPTMPAPTTPAPTKPAPTTPAPTTPVPVSGKVAVQVTDAYSRSAIAGVAVNVKTGNTLLTGAVTDASGKVEVKGVATGTVTVFLADGDAKRAGGAYPSTAVQVAVGSGTSYVAATLSRIVPVTAPTYAGPAVVGFTLTAAPGAWQGLDLSLSYQWLRNGVAIPGATAKTYTPTSADTGKTLTVRVLASAPGAVTRSSVSPKAMRISAQSTTTARVVRANRTTAVVRVQVTAPGVASPSGTLRLRVGGRDLTRTIAVRGGVAEVRLARSTVRRHKVLVRYSGQTSVLPSHARTERY